MSEEQNSTPTPLKTFEELVHEGYFTLNDLGELYKTERHRWNAVFTERSREFWDGIWRFAIQEGVPSNYAAKVVAKAWRENFMAGYYGVVDAVRSLAELFK